MERALSISAALLYLCYTPLLADIAACCGCFGALYVLMYLPNSVCLPLGMVHCMG